MSIEQQKANRARVILADDNKKMRDIVTHLLEDEFEVVGVVSNGQALVDAVKELSPNVGVIDISMPIMNGIEAAIEIRKHGPPLKIIFLTVHEDADFVRAAFEAGAAGYVVKRQMATDLKPALERVLAGQDFISPCCASLHPDLHG